MSTEETKSTGFAARVQSASQLTNTTKPADTANSEPSDTGKGAPSEGIKDTSAPIAKPDVALNAEGEPKLTPGTTVVQDEINARTNELQAQALRMGEEAKSMTSGNVYTGGQTTHTGSLSPDQLLASLREPYQTQRSADLVRPAGYYTVHVGSVFKDGGKRIRARSIGGLFYFDPQDLDEKAKAKLDGLVRSGLATEEKGNGASSTTE